MEELKFNDQENREQIRMKRLSEVEPLEDHHYDVENKEDLSNLVEGPLLSACQNLFDKNIQTYMSSANKKDIGGKAHFSIIYSTLSKENKDISQKLVKENLVQYIEGNDIFPTRIQVEIPVDEDTTWGEIEDGSLKVADLFAPQRKLYTPEDMMNRFYFEIENDPSVSEIAPEYFEKYGYLYDPEVNVFFEKEK